MYNKKNIAQKVENEDMPFISIFLFSIVSRPSEMTKKFHLSSTLLRLHVNVDFWEDQISKKSKIRKLNWKKNF